MPRDPGGVDEWFAYARDDLEAARVLLEAEDINRVVAIAQLEQALEKALKGFLIARGWELVRTHDLTFLLAKALEHEASLEEYRDVCEAATEAYAEEGYPGMGRSSIQPERAWALYEQGAKLIDILEGTPS